MKFEPGHEKLGGRAKGVPNRRTRFLHEVLEANGFSVVHRLIELVPKLDPIAQASVLVRLLPYLYPQRKPVDSTWGTGEQIPADLEDTPATTEARPAPVTTLTAMVDELRAKFPDASIMGRGLEMKK